MDSLVEELASLKSVRDIEKVLGVRGGELGDRDWMGVFKGLGHKRKVGSFFTCAHQSASHRHFFVQ